MSLNKEEVKSHKNNDNATRYTIYQFELHNYVIGSTNPN